MPRDTFTSGSDDSILTRAFGIVRRRKVVAALAFTTVLAAVVSFVTYLPDLYQASAIVVVERPLADGAGRAVAGDLERRLFLIKEEVLSRDRLTALVKRYNLYPDLRDKMSFGDILIQARNDIDWAPNGPERVSGSGSTVTFNLMYTGSDPKVVADVANEIAQFYVAYNDQMRVDAARGTAQLRKGELDATRRKVQELEGRMSRFVAEHSQQLPQAVGLNTAAFNRLNEELRRNGDTQYRIQIEKDRLLDALEVNTAAARELLASTTTVTGDENVPMSKEYTELAKDLESAREELRKAETANLGAGHPTVTRAKEKIADLDARVEAQRREDLAAHKAAQKTDAAADATPTDTKALPRGSRRSVEDLDGELARLKKGEADIEAQLDKLELRFEGAPTVGQEYMLLTRDLDAAKSDLQTLQRDYDQARSVETVETGRQGERFRILDAAIPPEGPATPNRLRLLIMGFLLALGAAAIAVIGAEKLDTSFHSVDDLREFTNIPVIATIPQIGSGPRHGYTRIVLGTASAIAAVVLVATLSAYFANGNEQIVRMLQRAG